jgi:uncharacterized protein YggE
MFARRALLAVLSAVLLVPVVTLADEPPRRTVSVSGSGEVAAQPDLAHVTLGVEARKPSLPAARAEVSAAVDRVLALTRELKIDPKLVNTTRLQIQPEYSWDEQTHQRVFLGYFVRRHVQVELRDLEQLGALLERAVDAGVNEVGDPALDSSRRKDLEREAMVLAVQDAKRNAETLAGAAGVKLGAVRMLSGSASAPPVPLYRQRVAMMDAAASAPAEASYQTGDMKFNASVAAEYDLAMTP